MEESVLNNESLPGYSLSMKITETMRSFKKMAGDSLCIDLSHCSVIILSQKELDDHSTLEEVCGSNTGRVVQIHFRLQYDESRIASKIHIFNVLKPSDEVEIGNASASIQRTSKWVASESFNKLRKSMNMSSNPEDWTESQVSLWISWAKKEFNLEDLNPQNFIFNGKDLLRMTREDFNKFAPTDPNNLFFMHLELLKQTRIVAKLLESPINEAISTETQKESPAIVVQDRSDISQVGSSTVHLWHFLLELLTDPKHCKMISWVGNGGEFRFNQPEAVAQLWGEKKGKNNMNYEKLARSLRYYYESETNVLTKIRGKRYVYKFELDLPNVLGYSPKELQEQFPYVCT